MRRALSYQLLTVFLLLFSSYSIAQQSDNIPLLNKLSNAHAAPGYEGSIRSVLHPIWSKYLTQLKTDGMGNMSGVVLGGVSGPEILLLSHMDEVGFLVRSITDSGFIQVEPLGGWRDQVAYAQRWKILTSKGYVLGYSGEESGHIVPKPNQATDASASTKLHVAREMYIDIGASSKNEAMNKFHIRPGLPITPDSEFTALNGSNKYLGKAFDDRLGLVILTDVIKHFSNTAHPNRLIAAATVQEELGLRGAKVIANEYKPKVVLNIEACIAGDHPLTAAPANDSYPSLGKGPCIYVYERSMMPNNKLVELVAKIARQNNIPFQYATAPNYGQDAAVIQSSGFGVPAIAIGIPVRYAHQQSGVIDSNDIEATVKLVNAVVMGLDARQVKLLMPQ